jgi:RNA polymerase sigma-70 factor (ECF subfamily)
MAEKYPKAEAELRFNSIVEEYGQFLHKAIVQLCPGDLGIQFADIEQEARLRLWRALEAEREIRDLASYIYRIAATTTIDAIRRAKARREQQLRLAGEEKEDIGIYLAAGPDSSPQRTAERRQIIEKVRHAMDRLENDRRRAIALYLEGMTSQEIAAALGWTEPKARNLTYRALKELRQQLEAEGINLEID